MVGQASYRVGVDIGGTFTDILLLAPDGSLSARKVPSTPDDYSRGILDGLSHILAELRLEGASIAEIVHGTTVATNAILEYTGARTALLTTRGFRDVLELRRVRAPELYNPFYRPPRPLVERSLRFEVPERTAANGEEISAVDEASVRATLGRLRTAGVESVAVCFLHSYTNPDHERHVGEMVRHHLPEVYVSLSVDVLPEIREYERTSTTVINAYLGPLVQRYLRSLRRQLADTGITATLLIMQSNGGIMTADAAGDCPAQIVESGPAAGVIASHRLGGRTGATNLITLDMGGTTAKASLIEDGRLTHTTEYEVGAGISLSSRLVKGGGHALKLPVLDIAEVGAGGGSIVWIDRGGALKVGPRSAGAVPGPACHDAGGTLPTATDANLVLGYMNPMRLAGGAIRLNYARAEEVMRTQVAAVLGMDLLEAAYGVFRVAAATMVRAVKAVSTYRGRDPRDFALLAFGGNGAVFAVELARALEIPRVIIPTTAGLFSALGLLEADLEQHTVRTVMLAGDDADPAILNQTFATIGKHAGAGLRDGADDGHVHNLYFADLRYRGQAFELTIPLPARELQREDVERLVEDFGQEHERTYGHRATNGPVEIVNLRMVSRATRHSPVLSTAKAADVHAGGIRKAFFGPGHGLRDTPVVARGDLVDGRDGPLIVEEYDATTVVPPGCTARLDEHGSILIDAGL